MKTFTLFLIGFFIGLFSCNQIANNKGTPQKKYNPIVVKTLYYPEKSETIEHDTLFDGYTINADIIPIKNSFIGTDMEYHDTSISNAVVRTYYQDYFLRIRIKSTKENFSIEKHIYKNEFKSILKPVPTNYFFRDIKFIELANNEFRFDLKLSFLDSKKAHGMIKYFIAKNKRTRFVDYPKSFYDHEFPSPD
jgi:hypothetical protein